VLPDSRNQGAYDFLSIMHYNRNSFAINSAYDTLEPLAPYTQYRHRHGHRPGGQHIRALFRRRRHGH
jgi:hypothetical protein